MDEKAKAANETLRMALIALAKAGTQAARAQKIEKGNTAMSEDTQDTDAKAWAQGHAIGIDMGAAAVLRALLHHVIDTSADPAALAMRLRSAALGEAAGINDGSGVHGPFITGVRAGAAERVEGLFVREPKARH